MNLVRCETGHFYDSDRFNVCPHCDGTFSKEEQDYYDFSEILDEIDDSDNNPDFSVPDFNYSDDFTCRPWNTYSFESTVETVNIREILDGGNAYTTTMSGIKLFSDSSRIESRFICKPTGSARDIYIVGLKDNIKTGSIVISATGLRYSSISFFTYWKSGEIVADESKEIRYRMLKKEAKDMKRYMKNLAKKTNSLDLFLVQHKTAEEYYLNLLKQMEKIDDEKAIDDEKLFGIHVVLKDEIKEETEVKLSYIYNKIYWRPYYIINADSTKDIVALDFYAELHTDMDICDVPITVSTGMDVQRIPTIRKLIIDQSYKKKYDSEYNSPAPSFAQLMAPSEGTFYGEAEGRADYGNDSSAERDYISKESVNVEQIVSDYRLSRDYQIQDAVSVNAGEILGILLETKDYPVEKNYLLVPSENPNAFLLMVSNELQEALDEHIKNMRNARAELFLDKEYIRSLHVNDVCMEHGLILSRTDGITSKRVVLETKVGKNIEERKNWIRNKYRIEIANKLEYDAKIFVYDNIPGSINEEIQIEVIQSSDAFLDKKKGIATWEVRAEAGKTLEMDVEYEITYPIGMSVRAKRS